MLLAFFCQGACFRAPPPPPPPCTRCCLNGVFDSYLPFSHPPARRSPAPRLPPRSSCLDRKLDEIKRAGGKTLGVDDDYTNLYRYAVTLRKEDTLDREERAGVEKSVVRAQKGAWNF